MFNDTEEKRFCLGVDELLPLIEADEDLKELFASFDLSSEEVLESIRNYMGHYVTTDFDKLDKLRDKLAGFLRKEFDFLSGEANVCAEEQLKRLVNIGTSMIYHDTGKEIRPLLLERWEKWFAYSGSCVSNELYETYDFERSENVIMAIVDQLGLPPMQEEYLRYFLTMKNGVRVYISDFENEILRAVGRSLVYQDARLCKLLDEFFKS
ncbi:hypothetical protein IKD67_03720 [Candidatus Saccharibacteria bacterium]|nr:hypothetical protein [Candidatus Saccharibacteria bacterium]